MSTAANTGDYLINDRSREPEERGDDGACMRIVGLLYERWKLGGAKVMKGTREYRN